MKFAVRGRESALRRALAVAATEQPTWSGDADRATFPGMRADVYRRRVGTGEQAFGAAAEIVMTWGVQRGSGLTVMPEQERVTTGGNVVVGMPMGPLLILAPCRISEVFDSPHRRGFRYVTLPGHPEIGFEEFAVEQLPDGEVWFTVRPVSRPGSVLMRLAGPIARVMERRASRRYLDAVRPTPG